MITEKRCICEKDFGELVNNTRGLEFYLEALKARYGNDVCSFTKDELLKLVEQLSNQIICEEWFSILDRELVFYNKYGYIDIVYNQDTKTFSRKKCKGRPKTTKCKDKRITIRLDEDQLELLNRYCEINNINDTSAAVRLAIKNLCK